MPFLRGQYYALNNHGSYANGQRIRVSTTQTLNAALVSVDQYTFGVGADYEGYSAGRVEVQADYG